MNETNIEGSIMGMLEPKVKEIQERFGKGEKLGLQDFNLLLLKTQYNHLNHLDNKLDQVSADVASLKTEFSSLRTEFGSLKSDFNSLKSDFNSLRTEFGFFKNEIELKFETFKNEICLKLDAFKNEIEFKIQKAINVNMRWSIGIIAFIVTILKVIDMIMK
jgi:uncharacterized coiled-coil DUF342 family protein